MYCNCKWQLVTFWQRSFYILVLSGTPCVDPTQTRLGPFIPLEGQITSLLYLNMFADPPTILNAPPDRQAPFKMIMLPVVFLGLDYCISIQLSMSGMNLNVDHIPNLLPPESVAGPSLLRVERLLICQSNSQDKNS